MLVRPTTSEEFYRLPSESEWAAELESGWGGSDGSSSSTDTIFGVRIGKTTQDPLDRELPAVRHDWHYRLLRRLLRTGQIDADTHARWRKVADLEYRDGCEIKCMRELSGFAALLRPAARYRVTFRYKRLREAGRGASIRNSNDRDDPGFEEKE